MSRPASAPANESPAAASQSRNTPPSSSDVGASLSIVKQEESDVPTPLSTTGGSHITNGHGHDISEPTKMMDVVHGAYSFYHYSIEELGD
jgi:hypothetical protein